MGQMICAQSTLRSLPLMIIGILLWAGGVEAQRDWEIHPGPVLAPGTGQWDALAVGQPSCLSQGGGFRIWFSGGDINYQVRILHASSSDGVTWSRDPNPALDVGNAGEWDAWAVDTPEVVQVDGLFYLYYFGQREPGTIDGSSIGMATSVDGHQFVRTGADPILAPGPPGAWDERWIESPSVVFDERRSRWTMWYTGVSIDGLVRIGMAISEDGVHWRKHPENPVISAATAGSWNDAWVGLPTVVPFRSGLWLIYAAVSGADLADGKVDEAALGFRWSLDGNRWSGDRSDPIITRAMTDSNGPWAPSLVIEPDRNALFLWFETNSGIWLATGSIPAELRHTGARQPPRREGLFSSGNGATQSSIDVPFNCRPVGSCQARLVSTFGSIRPQDRCPPQLAPETLSSRSRRFVSSGAFVPPPTYYPKKAIRPAIATGGRTE